MTHLRARDVARGTNAVRGTLQRGLGGRRAHLSLDGHPRDLRRRTPSSSGGGDLLLDLARVGAAERGHKKDA